MEEKTVTEETMSSAEIIQSLKMCGGRVSGCRGCPLRGVRKIPDCYDHLKLMAAKEIEILISENNYLRRAKDEADV